MSELSEEWKKIRQELGNFMCKLDNATNRVIVSDEQRKKVYDTAFESGWQNGRNDLWDRIDDYFTLTMDNTERHKIAKEMEHTAFSDIVSAMSPDTFTTRLTTYHEDRKKANCDISVGDECYYLLSGDSPDNRFIITKIYDGENGLGEKEKFFDGVYHNGRTISDGSLRLVTKTGNYYPIMNALLSPFDEPPVEVKKDGKV